MRRFRDIPKVQTPPFLPRATIAAARNNLHLFLAGRITAWSLHAGESLEERGVLFSRTLERSVFLIGIISAFPTRRRRAPAMGHEPPLVLRKSQVNEPFGMTMTSTTWTRHRHFCPTARGTQFSARSEGRSERCLSAIEQRKKPGKTYYTRLGMPLAMKPTLALSRLQILLIGTCCAYMWPQSISAVTPKAAAVVTPMLVNTYSSADIRIPAIPTRSAATNTPGEWLKSRPVALFGMVGLGMIVAAISVRLVCLSSPPQDASTDPSRARRTTKSRTAYDTADSLESRSLGVAEFIPISMMRRTGYTQQSRSAEWPQKGELNSGTLSAGSRRNNVCDWEHSEQLYCILATLALVWPRACAGRS